MATTSPLAAALKPSLPVDGESEAKYQSALSQLSAALEKRKNIAGDAADVGYLAGLNDPSVRGMGFAAEFASGLKGARAAQLEQAKEEQDIASLRLQIAQSEREAAMKRRGLEFFENKPTEATSVSAAAPGANILGAASARGAATAPGAATTPAARAINQVTQGNNYGPGVVINGREVTPDMIARLQLTNPDVAKAYESVYKMTMDSISVQPGGYVNKLTREYIPFPGKPPVTRIIPGVGKIEMPEEDAMALDKARREGNSEKYWSIVDSISKPMSRKPAASAAVTTPVGDGAAPIAPTALPEDRRTTAASLEAEAAAQRERAVKMSASEAERTNFVLDSGKTARGAQASYARAQEILATPGIEKVMGLINRGNVISGIANLVTDTLRVGNYVVGMPAIKKILTDSGVPQDILNKALELGQLEAMWQMETRKGLGAGTSVSNMEQLMANRVTPSQDDPIGAYKQKLAFLQEKAKFDVQLARELKRRKVTYDEFEDTDAFENMYNDYQARLMSITTGKSADRTSAGKPAAGAAPSATPAASGAAPAASAPITAESLRERLNRQRSNP